MCGIVGFVGESCLPEDQSMLRSMAETLRHRGPDGEGYYFEGGVGFGHRRLAIIDPAGSPQPMTSSCGNFVIVFNGEIFNYRELRTSFDTTWRTEGDTEVLLELFARYGTSALPLLRGQFAFAILDRRDSSVTIARDRLGIIPLFYARREDRFVFASEAKALRPALAKFNLDTGSLRRYLEQRAVSSPGTLIEGVEKLSPGCWAQIRPSQPIEPQRYWSLETPRPHLRIGPSEAVDELEKLLTLAVEDALVADVPVGAYLSGGVDSSIVVALAARLTKASRLDTFTAAFPASKHNEADFARRISDRLGTSHHEIVIEPSTFYEDLWRLSWYRDFPISETSDIAVAALGSAASKHVKVVLSGEGSDELFGGYPKYRFAGPTRRAGVIPVSWRRAALRPLQQAAARQSARLGSLLRAMSAGSERERFAAWFSPFDHDDLERLAGPTRELASTYPALAGDAVRRMNLVDLASWLPDNLLERGDRMTMASSVELRPPFLDNRVVEFALQLSSRVKLHHNVPKWPVREVARRLVGAEHVDRPKIGFQVPISDWFRTSLRDEVRDLLISDASHVRQWLHRPTIDRLVSEHLSGSADRGKQLWPLVSLEIWARVVLDQKTPLAPRP